MQGLNPKKVKKWKEMEQFLSIARKCRECRVRTVADIERYTRAHGPIILLERFGCEGSIFARGGGGGAGGPGAVRNFVPPITKIEPVTPFLHRQKMNWIVQTAVSRLQIQIHAALNDFSKEMGKALKHESE